MANDNLVTQTTPATPLTGTVVATRSVTYSGDASAQIAPVGLVTFAGSDDAKTVADVPGGGGVEATALRVTVASDSTGQIKLAAGSAVVGHVIVDTAPTTAVTGPLTDTQLRATPVPISGTVTITDGSGAVNVIVDSGSLTANAGTNLNTSALALDATLTGIIKTDDAGFTPATDKIVMIGAQADDTSPDSVNEGDAGALRMSLARALHTISVCDAATLSAVNSSASNVTLLSANANRIGVIIFNDDANALYIKYGATATTTDMTVRISGSFGYWEMPQPVYRGQIDGIWAADGSGAARITELT